MILFSESDGNIIDKNTVFYNTTGINFIGSWSNLITKNIIKSNTNYGISLSDTPLPDGISSLNNTVTLNHFIDNHSGASQAYDDSIFVPNQFASNYWSDYEGSDVEEPFGFGDSDYVIDGAGDNTGCAGTKSVGVVHSEDEGGLLRRGWRFWRPQGLYQVHQCQNRRFDIRYQPHFRTACCDIYLSLRCGERLQFCAKCRKIKVEYDKSGVRPVEADKQPFLGASCHIHSEIALCLHNCLAVSSG